MPRHPPRAYCASMAAPAGPAVGLGGGMRVVPADDLRYSLPLSSRLGPTPMPTCPPGQGGSRKRMWLPRGQRSGYSVGPPVKRRAFCF